MKKIILPLLSFTLFVASGCAMIAHNEKDTAADRIARPAFMVDRTLSVGGFDLKAWERMHQPRTTANIYIEGDGVIWEEGKGIASGTFDKGNTPSNPVALHLASRDLAKNVAYLARPCQYLYNPEDKGCSSHYWGTRRYSRDVVKAYNDALDEMKARYDITKFNLIGFDGGAAIASYLAAERDDVASLRTVAGVLNHGYITAEKGMAPLKGSLDAIDIAPQLAKVPQIHFIGGADNMVTPGVYHSYRQAMGTSDCIQYSMVQDASHFLGWVDKWPSLVSITPSCKYGEPEEFDMKAYNEQYIKGVAKQNHMKQFK